MQFTQLRHGRLMRISNRFGGDHSKEILDSSSFPRHLGREMIDDQRMRIELAEQIIDWRHYCTKPVQPLPVNGAQRTVLVWPTPSQNGTQLRASRNGLCREPITPRSWFRRHPHTPAWFIRPTR